VPEITLPNNWKPRKYQYRIWDYLQRGGKRAIEIAHRRWGKDDVMLHYIATAAHERIASFWTCLPEYEQGRKALWDSINAHTGKRRIDEAFPPEIRESKDEQKMFIKLKCGSTWQIIGSDRYDATVGAGVAGIVYSEWALALTGAGKGAPDAASASLAFTLTDANATFNNAGWYWYSGGTGGVTQNIGAATADRVVVLFVSAYANVSTVAGITIAGYAVTKAAEIDGTSTSFYSGIYYLLVTPAMVAGSTALIKTTQNVYDLNIMVGTITGSASATFSATGNKPHTTFSADPQSVSCAVPTNGVGVVTGLSQLAGWITPSWSGDVGNANITGGMTSVNAFVGSGGSSSPSFTGANNATIQLLMVTFGP
jgi:hypothetical protein